MSHVLHKLYGKHPVSHLFLKLYAEAARDNPEETVGALVREVYAQVYGVELDDEALEEVAARLHEHGERVQEVLAKTSNGDPAKAKPRRRSERGRGDYYDEWLTGQDISQTMFWLTGYNAQEARRLYEEEDYEIVEAMISTKRLHDMELGRLQFEAALFGFGGHYGNGKRRDEGEVRVHDMSNMSSADALNKLAELGRRR